MKGQVSVYLKAPPRILFWRGQLMTLSVTDVFLSPTVPSVWFLTVENLI